MVKVPVVDIERCWGIKPDKVELFKEEVRNPSKLASECLWLVNDSFILKSSRINDDLEVFDSSQLFVEGKVPVLKSHGCEKVVVGGDVMTYELFDYVSQTSVGASDYLNDSHHALDIGQVLSNISSMYVEKCPEVSVCKLVESALYKLASIESHSTYITQDLVLNVRQKLQQKLFPYLKYLNKWFCHGDFHPGNLLWKDRKLNAVIDWEGSCYREELFDLAYFMGCVGMDDPANLQSPWAESLLLGFVRNANPTKLGFLLLPELVLATRVAWLSTWLSHEEDLVIAEQEIAFIKILMEELDNLRSVWLNYAQTDFNYSKQKWVFQDAARDQDIELAKQRYKDIDLLGNNLILEAFQPIEGFACDLRLLSIDAAISNDLIRVINLLVLMERIVDECGGNKAVRVEFMIMLGNIVLCFSRWQMLDAIVYIESKVKALLQQNTGIRELQLGYAILLRNISIAYAEVNDINKMQEKIAVLDQLAIKHNNFIEILEELGRALSNGVTSLLGCGLSESGLVAQYVAELAELHEKYGENRKIVGAYRVMLANMKRNGL